MAKRAGVTPKTLRAWRDDEGLNLNDVEAVLERAAAISSNDETLADARRRKAIAAADAEEIRVQRLKGKLLDREMAEGIIMRIAHTIKMHWAQSPSQIAGMLDGRVYGEAQKALENWIDNDFFPRWEQTVKSAITELEKSIDAPTTN